MKAFGLTLLVAASAIGGISVSASAGPRYQLEYARPPSYEPDYYYAPPVGVVFSRHSDRCDYPNGFNVTDFTRSINGTPRGGGQLLVEGCGSLDLFEP